ncbi:MAG: methionine--tRNA ligase [Candidatus Doudnabacteria bacterium]|nr:methionine--tRNA ligase [Candidatus Doudnabacteria bacterium]
MEKFYITTPIYYINDKPHIGSAYTTIAADVLARYYRNKGVDTFFLAGTAEHGSKIATSAEKAGKDPQSFADEMSAKFSTAWDVLQITNNDFIRTTEKRHAEAVNKFFLKLKDSGKIYEGEYEGLYCIGHEAFIKESELVNGVCPDHKTKPEMVKEKNWFFKLSEYGPILKEKILSLELVVAPEERKNEILSFIDQGLEDIAISRQNAKFALPLPWDESQTIYVWLDELFNYCTAVGYGTDTEKFNKYWPVDMHLVGKDIIKFHCVIWPALLLAIGEKVPKKVFAHGFFTIDGQKISKTIGNVIDPIEWATKYGPDVVRYFLLREVPFGQDGDISEEKLKLRYSGDLANGLGNLLSRITTLVEKYSPSLVIGEAQLWKTSDNIDELIENYKFHEALAKMWEWVAWGNKAVDENKLWELGKTDVKKFEEISTQILSCLVTTSTHLQPFMPEVSRKILEHLKKEKITKAEPLFPRVQ